ncbi:MAG: hypothetical protein GC179_12285 [Anaerolineaceae bacterium]|nr:hypothetical protein [Anaerolineaceae bacterium]
MPIQYAPDLKQQALEIIRDTGGDINAAHIKTGVPERTLYRWRNELWQSWRRTSATPVLPNPPKPLPQFEDDLEAMDFIRQKIMSELLNLANNFQADSNFMTPAQRIMLLTQLTDRFIKLDTHVRAREEENTEYIYEYEVAHHVEKEEDPEGMYWNDREWVPIVEGEERVYWGGT